MRVTEAAHPVVNGQKELAHFLDFTKRQETDDLLAVVTTEDESLPICWCC